MKSFDYKSTKYSKVLDKAIWQFDLLVNSGRFEGEIKATEQEQFVCVCVCEMLNMSLQGYL